MHETGKEKDTAVEWYEERADHHQFRDRAAALCSQFQDDLEDAEILQDLAPSDIAPAFRAILKTIESDVKRLQTLAETGDDPEAAGFYSLADLADLLKVSRRTLFRWIKSGKLKAVKIGSQWRVKSRDLADLSAGKQ